MTINDVMKLGLEIINHAFDLIAECSLIRLDATEWIHSLLVLTLYLQFLARSGARNSLIRATATARCSDRP